MVRVSIGFALLVGCGHPLPPVATSANPDELCVHDAGSAPKLVAPHGDRVGVCYDDGRDCLVVDHVHGTIVARVGWPNEEESFEPELHVPQRTDAFELERTETETSVCDHAKACRTFRIPNIVDQATVMPAISLDGQHVYYVARDGDHASLDTIEVASGARTARVPLAGRDSSNHFYWSERIGGAILVRDSVSLGLNSESATQILVDPTTGARRELLAGHAIELDDQTVIVIEAKRTSIVATRGLSTIATRAIAARASVAGANEGIAVIAYNSPPSIVVVEKHGFTREWRLPVCH